MPAPALLDLSKRACIKNARAITDVGRFEYWKIRPILQHVESPDQLHQIEIASPHIALEDAELWRAFIIRDIPNWQRKNYVPKDPTKWHKVYRKYMKEHEEDLRQDEAILRGQFSKLKKEKNENQSEVINTVLRPPRHAGIRSNPRMKAMQKQSAVLAFTGGSKTKMKDGKSVLLRAKREAREIAAMSKLSKPARALPSNIGQVKQAPVGMVNEYKRGAQPATRIYSPQKKSTSLSTKPASSALEEREARLRAMQKGNTAGKKHESIGAVKENYIDSSDSEDGQEPGTLLNVSDLEDLFDENGSPPASTPPTSQSSPSAFRASSKPSPSAPRPLSKLSPKIKAEPRNAPARTTVNPEAPASVKPLSMQISKSLSPPRKGPLLPPLVRDMKKEGSPAPGPRPMMQKRKKEVDIFARPKKIVRRS